MSIIKTVLRTASYGKTVINLVNIPNCVVGEYMIEVVNIGRGRSMCFYECQYTAESVFRNTATYHRITRGKDAFAGIQGHKIEGDVGSLIEVERITNQNVHDDNIKRKLASGELMSVEDPYRKNHFINVTPKEFEEVKAEYLEHTGYNY